ncbi:ankyrin repeat domain-containing protein [Trinickia acidisoli]|uniref:ankyrin repeat domain-containing protein n=1 Tax=Trinickia acidisoli TaxID=2767482 RepID=UPI0035AC0578
MNTHTDPSLPLVSRRLLGRLLHRLALTCAGAFASLAVAAHASDLDSLVKAVKFDDVSAVQKALAHGEDPNATDSQGMPLIVLAAREKSDKVAQALMADPKTDIEKLDSAGENAMMLAALNGDTGLVQALIDKGAEVNKKGWAPLHYAAANGHDDIVKLLLEHSAYVDAGSPNGTTPLMMAARGNHLLTVKVLLDAGAQSREKNQLGLTALDFAKRYHAKDVTEALQDMYAREATAASGATGASTPAQNGAK